jgi:RNA polymerase sigma-70 factor (ECF subfamily)
MPLIIDELHECLPATESTETIIDDMVLVDVFNRFLASLPVEQRKIFMRRYWYMSSVKEIAADYGMGESKVKMSLLRSRNELKRLLEKEGITI